MKKLLVFSLVGTLAGILMGAGRTESVFVNGAFL